MALPGLLIEYLVGGLTALLWIWVLLWNSCGDSLQKCLPSGVDPKVIGALAIPFAYIVGMVIDFISRELTDRLRKLVAGNTTDRGPRPEAVRYPSADERSWLKERVEKWRLGFRKDDDHARKDDEPLSQQEVMLASAELGKQVEIRSSRDRVARGAFLNALIGTVVLSRHYYPERGLRWAYILVAGSALCFILFLMWHRFDRLTNKYRHKAGEAIKKRLARNGRQP
jgi:hypothetical protein